MSQSFDDDSDGGHSFSEYRNSHRGEKQQIVARTRESFFIVRKPTKNRLAAAKNPSSAKSFKTPDLLQSKRYESSILAGTAVSNRKRGATQKNLDTHEDELSIKSSLSVSIPAVPITDRLESAKDRSIASSISKNSKFRISRIPFLEKIEIDSTGKIPFSEETAKASAVGGNKTPINQKGFTNPYVSNGIETRYLRAINDKAEYSQIESIGQNEGLDKKLRGLLKKHAIKKKETYDMLEVLRKLKLNQSRSFLYKFGIRFRNKAKKHYANLAQSVKDFLRPIDPQGIFMSIWHSLLMFFIFYELVAVPFELAFDHDYEHVFNDIEWVETVFFSLDMLMGFSTSWYQDGVLVNDRRLIIWYYLKSWFIIDLLCCFPFQLLFEYNVIGADRYFITLLGLLRAVKLVRIAKAFKIKGAFSKIEDYVRLSGELNGIMRLIKLCFTIGFIAHWCACFWHLIGAHPGTFEEHTWIINYNLQDAKTSERYVKSLYWSVTTLLTVGYGDLVPINQVEQIYSIFVMLLGSGIIGFSMNKIGEILQQINSEVNYREKKLLELRKFMDKNEIDSKLQIKAKQYIEFKLEHERALRESDRTILQSLSQSLRDQMLKQVNGRVMKNSELFQKSFGSSLLTRLAMMLEEQLLAPDEFVFREHETEDLSLYFIARGRVQTLFEKYKVSLNFVEKGSYIGEFSFFTGRAREVSAKTLTFTSIFCLPHNKFLEILESFPTDKEMYHMLKDKINIWENYSCIGAQCDLCKGGDHMAWECHKTHLVIDKQKIIRHYLECKQSFQKNFQRKSKIRFHTLKDHKYVEKAVRRVQTVEGFKNQMTHTSSESDNNINTNETKNAKKLTFVHLNSEEGQNHEMAAEAIYKTLARIKDEETGVTKLIKKRRSFENEDQGNMNRMRKSMTMKHNGEAVFVPFKIQIGEKKPEKQIIEEEVNIDQMKNYEIYFPHNNLTKVIQQYEDKKAKKKPLRINLTSEQDIASFKMKLGKIFDKNRKKNGGSEASSREPSPALKRRKSMFFTVKSNAVASTGLARMRSKSLTKVGGAELEDVGTVEFDRKEIPVVSKSKDAIETD